MTPQQRSIVGLLVRAVLMLGGGELLDHGQWEQVLGAIVILATLGWSAYQKLSTVPPARTEAERPSPSPYQRDLARRPAMKYGKRVQ